MKPTRVLIEASKIREDKRDGCYRYTTELLRALSDLTYEKPEWDLQLLLGMKACPIHALPSVVQSSSNKRSALQRLAVNLLVRLRQTIAVGVKSVLSEPAIQTIRRIDRRIGVTRGLQSLHQGGPYAPVGFDLVHLTLPQAYQMFTPDHACRMVVTIHDCTHLFFPEFHLDANVRETERGIQEALRRRAHFIAVSEATRQEFIDAYRVQPERVRTTHLSVDHNRFHPVRDQERLKAVRQKYRIPERPYFFALSTLEPRKNTLNMVRAFRELVDQGEQNTVLVVGGKVGWKCKELFEDPASISDRVHFIGFVEERDLPALYGGALAFLFVSHYEGFGLPALEAMACGTPVIYGDRGAMPEIIDGAGLAADPNRVEQIRDCLRAVAFDPDCRAALVSVALQRVKQFSWSETARKTLDLYRTIAES